MAGSNFIDAGILGLIYQAVAITGIATNATSAPIANIYVALHTADPGQSGNQSTSEIAYTGYARVAVVRSSSGWALTGNVINPAATITWPTGTGGSGTATFWSTGVASSGATNIINSGPISPSIVCGVGVTPQLTTATSIAAS